MKNISYLSCCILAALLGTSPAFANDQNNCEANDTQCEEESVTLSTVTISATRTETDTSKYAGSIGVLKQEDIAPSSNIVDGLSVIPGVETGGDGGRTIGSQYTIRGFGYQSENRVIVRQNGVPQSPSLFSNHISSYRTDADILKRVEVVKGASSILYGSGAIGGIVNMTTKDARDYLSEGETFGGLLGLRYEENNMHSVRAAVYGKSSEVPVDFVLYRKQSKHGDIDLAEGGTESIQKIDNDENIDTTYFNVGFDINDEQRVMLSVFDYDENLKTVWQTLYHYTIDETTPVVGSLQQTDYVLDYTYKSASNDWLDLSAKVYRSKAYYDRGWDSVDEDTGAPDTLSYKNEETRWGFNIKNIARFKTGAVDHVLLVGVDFNNREEDAIYNRNGVNSDFGSMPNTYDDWGVYIQDIMTLDKLELTVGGRYDKFDRSIDKPNSTSYNDTNFSPRVALAYEITDGFNFLLGYSETFRAPTPHETSSEGALNPHYYYVANPDLGPETAKEIEGGFSYNAESLFTDNDMISVKAMAFDGKINDMITLEVREDLGTPPESRFYAQYQNVKNAKRKGYEISARYLIDSIRVDSSFEHLELYDEVTGENVIQGFADKLQLMVSYYAYEYGVQIGLGMNHWFKPDQNPETIVSRGTTYTYVNEAYTQFNLRGHWDIPVADYEFIDSARVNFGVNNLTDKQYINARYTTNTSRVGTGRNAYIDIEFDF